MPEHIRIKARRLKTLAWQMTLVDERGGYVGTVTSPLEGVAWRMAEAAAEAAQRYGRVGGGRPAPAEACVDG